MNLVLLEERDRTGTSLATLSDARAAHLLNVTLWCLPSLVCATARGAGFGYPPAQPSVVMASLSCALLLTVLLERVSRPRAFARLGRRLTDSLGPRRHAALGLRRLDQFRDVSSAK